MRTHRNASWASAHRASTVKSAVSRKLSPASVIGWSSTMTIRGREPALRAAAPLATKARSRERLSMPKVGSSLVDSPVTVNRERVFIMTRFRKRQQMSVIEGDDGPDHDNDGRRAGDSPEPKPGLDVVQVIHDQSETRQRNLLQQRSTRPATESDDRAQVNYVQQS